MANEIHAVKRGEEFRFRLWSTVSDSYTSNEMSESEVRECLLKKAVCEAIDEHNRAIGERIERAVAKGTSSRIGGGRDLKKWSKRQK